jgi:mucin-19
VISNVPGVLPNTTSGVTTAQTGVGPVSNTATLTVNAITPAIVKTFVTPTIAIGGTSQIDFTIVNTNGIPLTGAAFSDTLTNMFVSATGAATGTCVGAGTNNFTANQTGLLNFTGLTIPANGLCTVSIVVRSNTPGTHPNFATGVSSAEAPTGAVSPTVNLTVNAAEPTVSKSFAPASILSGGTSTLTITLTNPNAGPVSITSLTDNFPTTPGTGLVRAATPNLSTTCAGSTPASTATSVSLAGGTIAPNSACTISVDVTAATAGSYVNTIAAGGFVTNVGSNTTPATATLTVTPVANVSVTKSGPAVIDWGTTITYTVTVSNAGPDAANGTVFTDNIPAAITGVGGSCAVGTGASACGAVTVTGNTVSSTITTLPAGTSVVFTITGTAPQSGTLANAATAIVPAGVNDPDDPTRVGAGNNTSNTVMTVVRAPNLALSKTATPIAMVSGGTGSFTITPNNLTGTAPTAGTITVTDVLPSGLTGTGAMGTGWNCNIVMQTVTCTSTDVIAAGGTGNAITVSVNVGSAATPGFTNIATVSGGNEPAVNNGNNTALVMVPVSGGAVSNFLTDGAQTGLPNTSVLYTHVFNGGTSGSVTFSLVRNAMPNTPGWTAQIYRDTNCNGVLDGLEGATDISNAPITLAAAGQVCIVVKSNIPGAAPVNAQDVITVTAAFTPTVGQPQNFTRVDITTVGNAGGGAGLTLSKAVRNITQAGTLGTSNVGRPGDVIEYVVTYTNTSNAPLSMITITDQVPAFTTLITSACTMPFPASITSCTSSVTGTGAITWTLGGSLGSNQSGTVTFRVTIQ